MLSLLALVALGSVELCTYIDPMPLRQCVDDCSAELRGPVEDCSGNVNTGNCMEVYNGTTEIDACTPLLADGSMGAMKVKQCSDSYFTYGLHSNADCSDDVSTPCDVSAGVNRSCTVSYTFGECETLSPPFSYSMMGFSFFVSGQYRKLTGACPGGGADSGEPSSCDGGCIGGVAGGCFVLVLVCTGWLSGAFAKIGCPPPCKKLSRVRPRHKTEDNSITRESRIGPSYPL